MITASMLSVNLFIFLLPHLEFSTLSPSSLPILIPQQAPQDLSTWALGNRINELDTSLEPLVVGLVLLHMLDNLSRNLRVRAGRHGSGCHNKGLWHFSVAIVVHSNDSAVIYGGVREEMGF